MRADRFLDPVWREFHRTFQVYPVDATRAAIAEHLMATSPADLTLVYLLGTDRMQHLLWKYYQPQTWPEPLDPVEVANRGHWIPTYYELTDELVGRLIARTGPRDTVLVVSDHGFGPAQYVPGRQVSGDHRLEGIIIAAGNHVRPGPAAASPSILDVTPTALYLLGLPVADDMEGRVIEELIDPTFRAAHPVRTVPTFEREPRRAAEAPVPSPMDDAIKERLRSLGYVQ